MEEGRWYLSDLLKGLLVKVGKDVAVGLREDLEGHGTVVVLKGRDVIVAHCELGASINLVAAGSGRGKISLVRKKQNFFFKDYIYCNV